MAQSTKIQWVDSTVNPTGGCDGCELLNRDVRKCYARAVVAFYGRNNPGLPNSFDELTTFPGRMAQAANWSDLTGKRRPDKPWLDDLPRLIFISDMSDALCDAFTFDFLKAEIIDNVATAAGSRHRWAWLTKRPGRMAEFSAWLADRRIAWPRNLWAGTSITRQATAGRIDQLLEVGNNATCRFVSVEPAWEAIDLRPWLPRLNCVIHGGESGSGAEPFDLAWARDLLAQCREARVPYFLKQVGSSPISRGHPVNLQATKGGDWTEWPKNLRVRQIPASPARVGARR
jgi:protein gp37